MIRESKTTSGGGVEILRALRRAVGARTWSGNGLLREVPAQSSGLTRVENETEQDAAAKFVSIRRWKTTSWKSIWTS